MWVRACLSGACVGCLRGVSVLLVVALLADLLFVPALVHLGAIKISAPSILTSTKVAN